MPDLAGLVEVHSFTGLNHSLKTHPRLREAARTMLARLATFKPRIVFDGEEEPSVVKLEILPKAVECTGDQLHELHLGFEEELSSVDMNNYARIAGTASTPSTGLDESARLLRRLADIPSCAGRVEYLQMQGIHAHLLASHCKGIRKLDMQYPKKRPCYCCPRVSLSYSQELWEALGPDLKDVSIQDVNRQGYPAQNPNLLH